MRTRTGIFLVLAVALVATLAPQARAEARLRRPAVRTTVPSAAVTVSGRCSGALSGEIRVDGTSYRLAPDAKIYEMGRGFAPAGVAYFDRAVTLSVVTVRGVPVVKSVLVRPADWPSDQPAVGVMDESTPR